MIDPERQVTVRSLRDSVVGVSLAYRCMGSVGRHWAADQLLPEVLDVETGASVPEGETGELVVTDLVREASPLIRYRTGLAVSFASEPCPCGRTSGRILHSKRFATP